MNKILTHRDLIEELRELRDYFDNRDDIIAYTFRKEKNILKVDLKLNIGRPGRYLKRTLSITEDYKLQVIE